MKQFKSLKIGDKVFICYCDLHQYGDVINIIVAKIKNITRDRYFANVLILETTFNKILVRENHFNKDYCIDPTNNIWIRVSTSEELLKKYISNIISEKKKKLSKELRKVKLLESEIECLSSKKITTIA